MHLPVLSLNHAVIVQYCLAYEQVKHKDLLLPDCINSNIRCFLIHYTSDPTRFKMITTLLGQSFSVLRSIKFIQSHSVFHISNGYFAIESSANENQSTLIVAKKIKLE